MNIKENLNALNKMILAGQNMEAFEKYYHDNVVMQENNNTPTVGKAANREREKQTMAMIVAFHGAELRSVAFGEDVSMAEWSFDMTYKGGHRVKTQQVAVQRWQDGKIIRETFYYSAT